MSCIFKKKQQKILKKATRVIQTKYRVSSLRQILNRKMKLKDYRLILCPKGDFLWEGYHESKETMGGSNPPKRATITRAFFLGETEVTQNMFIDIMGFDPANEADLKLKSETRAHLPVNRINWYEAVMFCNRLSEKLGYTSCYHIQNIKWEEKGKKKTKRIASAIVQFDRLADGFRLPTIKEWEYAAKAGTNNKWAGVDDAKKLNSFALYGVDSFQEDDAQSEPVKSKKPNEWGFYDMTGNVDEWCWDANPYLPTKETKYTHGGNINDDDLDDLKIGSLSYKKPDASDSGLGFRLARTNFRK